MKRANTMSTITVELTIKVKTKIHFFQCRKYQMDSSHHRCQIFTMTQARLEDMMIYQRPKVPKIEGLQLHQLIWEASIIGLTIRGWA